MHLLALAVAGALLGAGPAAAADLDPATLPPGPAPAVAHLEGRTLVDGDVRIVVAGRQVRLLGTTGSGYLVESSPTASSYRGTVWRYGADSAVTALARTDATGALLSSDAALLLVTDDVRHVSGRSVVTAYDVVSGAVVGRRTFGGSPRLLDAYAGRVVVSGYDPRVGTSLWTPATGAVDRITARSAHAADLAHDLLASYTSSPYDGGAEVVSSTSHPHRRLWSSRTERVEAFSTDGSRMALVGLFVDGPVHRVVVRRTTGRRLATYAARRVGRLEFESGRALLLDVHDGGTAALVRCTDGRCERAGQAA